MTEHLQDFRDLELKAIYRFIARADITDIASIISEIKTCHHIYINDKPIHLIEIDVKQMTIELQDLDYSMGLDDDR